MQEDAGWCLSDWSRSTRTNENESPVLELRGAFLLMSQQTCPVKSRSQDLCIFFWTQKFTFDLFCCFTVNVCECSTTYSEDAQDFRRHQMKGQCFIVTARWHSSVSVSQQKKVWTSHGLKTMEFETERIRRDFFTLHIDRHGRSAIKESWNIAFLIWMLSLTCELKAKNRDRALVSKGSRRSSCPKWRLALTPHQSSWVRCDAALNFIFMLGYRGG